MNRTPSVFARKGRRFAGAIAAILFGSLVPVASASADTWVRADGIRFDSDVGAVCGALNTDILFMPGEGTLDIHDTSPLDYLARCFRTELADHQIGVVAPTDGGAYGAQLSIERQNAVMSYLIAHGVRPSQLVPWRYNTNMVRGAEGGRIQFRIADRANIDAWYVR